MKTVPVFAFILFVFVLSCKKEPASEKELGILYPSSTLYGVNILSLPDSTVLQSNEIYSFCAELEKDATLTVKIINLSEVDSTGHIAVWFYDNNDGWTVSDYSNDLQIFTSSQTGSIDLEMSFQRYYLEGACRIDMYENSTEITKTIFLFWQ